MNKHIYSIDEVEGDLKSRLIDLIKNTNVSEDAKVSNIFIFIDGYSGYLSLSTLSVWCLSHGYWDVFRRSAMIFNNILKEHNHDYDVQIRSKYDDSSFNDDFYEV